MNRNGKTKRYNTPNSTANQTVGPQYRPEQAPLGSGMAGKAKRGAMSYRERMRQRMKQAGL